MDIELINDSLNRAQLLHAVSKDICKGLEILQEDLASKKGNKKLRKGLAGYLIFEMADGLTTLIQEVNAELEKENEGKK